MSIDATRWAWQQPIKASQKIVLLSLADRAGENHDCYPSIKRLSQDCGMSRSSLFARLEELEKMGLIQRINRSSEKSGTISNIYQLVGVDDRKITPIQSSLPPSKVQTTPVQSSDYPRPKFGLPPSKVRTTPVQSSDTEPSINHHINNNNNNTETALVNDLSLSLIGLDEKQKVEASKKLAQLSQEQRDIAVEIFNNTAQQGRIKKSPMALLNQLVNMGLNNELEAPTSVFNTQSNPIPNQAVKMPVNEPVNEEEARIKENAHKIKIAKQYIGKYKEAMLDEFKRLHTVYISGYGAFFEPELRAAGLFD